MIARTQSRHTHLHALLLYLGAGEARHQGRAAEITGLVGAAFPDLPAFAAVVYFWDEWDSMPREELLSAIYFTGPFGVMGTALHRRGRRPAGALLVASVRAPRPAAHTLVVLLGWAGHTVVDFLTHVDDTRRLLWPLLGWKWSSFVSYYNLLYYGREFMVVEQASMLAIMVGLLVRRLCG